MKTTLDQFGRIVIPKEVRDDLGLYAGLELLIQPLNDEIVVKVAQESSVLKKEGHVLIHTGKRKGDLERAVQKSREDRTGKFVQLK